MVPPERPPFQQQLSSREPATATSAVMTVVELAGLLRVNRKSAYAAVARGEVPGVVRVGHRIRISRAAVEKWLLGGGVLHGVK